METNHKPVKIETGRYLYRGIIIRKETDTEFTYDIVTHSAGLKKNDLSRGGWTTLKNCVSRIDSLIERGWQVRDDKSVHSPEAIAHSAKFTK